MGSLFRVVPPRGFKYKPRFYNPDDEGETPSTKPRLKFRRLRRSPQRLGRPLVVWIFLVMASLYLYWRFNHHVLNGIPWQVESLKRQESDH